MTRSADKDRSATSPPRKPRRHCNDLNGKRWLQNSISVWSDIRKTTEETRLKHPAMFPQMLAERLIETFLAPEGTRVLDPFTGSGSTLLAAERMGRQGLGLELSGEYVALARHRLAELSSSPDVAASAGATDSAASTRRDAATRSIVHHAPASDLPSLIEPESIDLCISSPPYWNILNQRRSADGKEKRHYGNLAGDLGTIDEYEQFLTAVTDVYADVLTTLKPRCYCCIVVMDLRKKNRFFPLHSDLTTRLISAGYRYDDLIIWNRQAEYNNLRPLGYPSVFRVNKVHEFILLMQKPE